MQFQVYAFLHPEFNDQGKIKMKSVDAHKTLQLFTQPTLALSRLSSYC